MAAASGSSSRPSWTNLAPDLLGLVLARLPSHVDRVRVSAVCPAWRSSARLQGPLPTLLPWLGLGDGAFLSLPDGAIIHRLPVPDDVLCQVSTGSALYLVHADGSRSLMRLSSSAATALAVVVPEYFRFEIKSLHKHLAQNIRKAVVSDHLSAVLIRSKVRISGSVMLSTRKPQRRVTTSRSPVSVWHHSLGGTNKVIADIAIFKGELYELTTGQELFVLNHRRRLETDKSCIPGVPWQSPNRLVKKKYYLVVSADQLLMVKRVISLAPAFQQPASRFEVFEATNLRSGHGRWRKVDNLNGRALFISEGCSQSLPATTIGVREDCIYFVAEGNNTSYSGKKIHEGPFLDSGVYNMREQTTTPLPFETVRAAHRGPLSSTWIFPE
uniref:Uncharacterized protein n=1 Tax=Avena sativa TaxID=4498 RepID=A0ACD6A9U4_AVESA